MKPTCAVVNVIRLVGPTTRFSESPISELIEAGNPVVLTINRNAELVVQDAASNQRLFDLAERLETIQAVKEGIASADRGEGRPMDDAFDAIEKELRRAKAGR